MSSRRYFGPFATSAVELPSQKFGDLAQRTQAIEMDRMACLHLGLARAQEINLAGPSDSQILFNGIGGLLTYISLTPNADVSA